MLTESNLSAIQELSNVDAVGVGLTVDDLRDEAVVLRTARMFYVTFDIYIIWNYFS